MFFYELSGCGFESGSSQLIGDFNAKIAKRIKRNMSTVTKQGRQLIKLIDKHDIKTVNKKYAKSYEQENKGKIYQ